MATQNASAPSRRALLAAGAAAAISAPGAGAAIAAAAAPDDPVFAAIDAARRAHLAYDAARSSIRAVIGDSPELRSYFIFVAKADGASEEVSTIEHLNRWLDNQGPAHHVHCKRTFAEAAARVLGIEEPPVADPAPEALAAWSAERAAVVADFERARRIYDEGRQSAGLWQLYETADKTADVYTAAEETLLAMVPTTAAGAVALLQFYADLGERYGADSEFLPVLSNALPALVQSVKA
ncbi:hypothetical protein [Rhodoblastus sp.]|uniref:hypothetical protein n=1 Tax=Rhodoblastus sp. TaxID=1962975 RepID=UPI0035B2DBFD